MSTEIVKKFQVIGIAVRTTNENGQAATDIQALWNRFMQEGILEKIPNKIDNTIYSIYTDYEKDHTKPYTTILGCAVSSLDEIPVGMQGKIIEQSTYSKIVVRGNIFKGLVFEAWVKIWNSNLPRTFTADYEVYGAKAQNREDAEVEIFVAVK
ncbi:MAG: effector binding domain-containing protein [Bacteroidetes bacterium]|nr:effector binding domain-containing protein [Bacteroidota bacterium]